MLRPFAEFQSAVCGHMNGSSSWSFSSCGDCGLGNCWALAASSDEEEAKKWHGPDHVLMEKKAMDPPGEHGARGSEAEASEASASVAAGIAAGTVSWAGPLSSELALRSRSNLAARSAFLAVQVSTAPGIAACAPCSF